MRSDMNKVITERPRRYRDYELPTGVKKRFQDTDWEDQPKREGMKAMWNGGTKDFTDVIGPLKGYLRKQARLGRPWNKVWSEIQATLPGEGLSASHAKDHIFGLVELDVMEVDGKPYTTTGRQIWSEMYVCPRSGILKINKEYRSWRHYKHKHKRDYVCSADSNTQYRKIDGHWHEITLVPLDNTDLLNYLSPAEVYEVHRRKTHRKNFDVYLERYITSLDYNYLKEVYGFPAFANAKRPLKPAEVRKLKLDKIAG